MLQNICEYPYLLDDQNPGNRNNLTSQLGHTQYNSGNPDYIVKHILKEYFIVFCFRLERRGVQ